MGVTGRIARGLRWLSGWVRRWLGRDDGIVLSGHYRFTFRNVETGETRIVERDNVVCTNGKSYLASLLNGEVSAPLAAAYGAVGTGNGSPLATDTQLFAELARALLASNTRSGNVLTWDVFFTTSQGNGLITEAGVFLGASATANSGNLLSHVLVSENKTNAETLTVEFSLTVGP